MVDWMPLLVGLLIYLYLPLGQSTEPEVVHGIGIKLCNVRCVQSGSCKSFAYDTGNLACHLSHKNAMNWTMEGLITKPKKKDQTSGSACSTIDCELNTRCVERRGGGAVCLEGDTVSSTLESSCLTDSDCSSVRKFVCFTNTCKCIPGYSFNPANNSCIRRCSPYGDGFTTYRGLDIKGHNDRTVFVTSAKECSDRCIREETFSCITYEIRSAFCQLSKSGYLDVPASQRSKGLASWSIGVRNCA